MNLKEKLNCGCHKVVLAKIYIYINNVRFLTGYYLMGQYFRDDKLKITYPLLNEYNINNIFGMAFLNEGNFKAFGTSTPTNHSYRSYG